MLILAIDRSNIYVSEHLCWHEHYSPLERILQLNCHFAIVEPVYTQSNHSVNLQSLSVDLTNNWRQNRHLQYATSDPREGHQS